MSEIRDKRLNNAKEELESNSQLARIMDTLQNFEMSLRHHKRCVELLEEIVQIVDEKLTEIEHETEILLAVTQMDEE